MVSALKKQVYVAIAILLQQQKILIGWRDAQLHQGGKYEFAGGKVEQGETAEQACRREVWEEVGILLDHWTAIDEIYHQYDDVDVRLSVYQAVVAQELNTQLKQGWQWVERTQLKNHPFPKANQGLIERLIWQPYIKIHHDCRYLTTLETNTLFYWRVPLENKSDIQYAVDKLTDFAYHHPEYLAQCIVNWTLWQHCPDDVRQHLKTIHLKHQQLFEFKTEQRVLGVRYLSACHDPISLQRAVEIGCDAVLCSPVLTTATHHDALAIGWQQLHAWIKDYPLPVFALGGLTREDLTTAQSFGAYGVAGIRGI